MKTHLRLLFDLTFRMTLGASLAGAATLAFAHAHLLDSQPANGAAVAASPSQIRFTFSEALETGFSSVSLAGPDGKGVDTGKLAAVGDDGKAVAVSVPPLPPGAYTANWSALAKDGHRTKGTVMFTVK